MTASSWQTGSYKDVQEAGVNFIKHGADGEVVSSLAASLIDLLYAVALAHRILFAANVPAFENLTQLAKLPPRGFDVFALPMKIGGGTGAPLRAIAVLPPSS